MTNTLRKEWSSLFSNIPVILLSILFFLLPVIFTSVTTDSFYMPKQLLIISVVTVSIFCLGMKAVIDGKAGLITTPFDRPVLILAIIASISSLLAANRYESLIAFVPLFHSLLLYFVIINSVRGKKALLFILGALVGGATISSIITILSFFKIYVLPFSYAKTPYFTTFGSLFDQALYLFLVLPIAGYFAITLGSRILSRRPASASPAVSSPDITKSTIFSILFVVISLGLGVTLYHLFTTQKPITLPYSSGFQIAFATISQDPGRMLQNFLVGSGPGTFFSDFNRFKAASYNANADLWSVSFTRSSSFVLELLSTMGILGFGAYLVIGYQFIKDRTFFMPVLLALIASLIFPFSPPIVALLFILLGVYAVTEAQNHAPKYNELEIHLVTVNEHDHSVPSNRHVKHLTNITPHLIILFIAGIVGYSGYLTVIYTISDYTFQQSIIASTQNNAAKTYDFQREAINIFPYRDGFHRAFSQTNLAIANALAGQVPQGSSPSAQLQQNVLTLIQQSINSARAATTLSPYNSINWNNLSSVYRSLIGFGQNAEQFAILTSQQAILLDPNNPQQYINIGGIYYQLKLYDEASRQFQTAINLKSDYPNAYYNLGHTYESKGDYQRALIAYNIVKQLIAGKDKTNEKLINDEITAINERLGAGSQQVAGASTDQPAPLPVPEETAKEPLEVNQPERTLPERNPRERIQGPTISPVSTVSVTPTSEPITPEPTISE